MKQITPHYYHKFRCTADRCRDNCCIGWEIDIDDRTLQTYQSLPGALGERLRASISLEETPHFCLTKERCPFLNHNGLCDIITALGESALGDICARHPRFYSWFGSVTEIGLSLCCEAAAALVFSHPEPLRLIETETDDPADPDPFDEALFQALCGVRTCCFDLLQTRSLPLSTRLIRVLTLGDQIQEALDPLDPGSVRALCQSARDMAPTAFPVDFPEPLLREILRDFEALEPIDDDWNARIDALQEHLPTLLEQSAAFCKAVPNRMVDYEQIAVSFLYRYLLTAVHTLDLVSTLRLTAVSVLMIHLLDVERFCEKHDFSFDDRVDNARIYSKEVEYSDENLDALTDAFVWLSHYQTHAPGALLQTFF